MIKGIVIGFILALAISVGCVFLYFSAGLVPVATADPPMPFEKKLANMALDAHIAKQHIPPSSVSANEANFLAGASVYKQHCAVCHGPDGRGNGPAAPSMLPRPRDFTSGRFKYKSTAPGEPPTDDDLLRTVRDGLPASAMPY